MDIGIMVEGQAGLTWERWAHILETVERLGFPSLFRSDHFFIGRQQQSLEPYLSFVMAAMNTRRIRFGPLVTPVTFRAPVHVGRMAAQIDELSGGRFVLGMGGGWNQPEHEQYGIEFPVVKERLDRLEEAIQVVRALWSEGPASFAGKYYHVTDVDCLPKPVNPQPPILIGGSGELRTLKIVAKYANEWNCVNQSPDSYRHKTEVLAGYCEANRRDPGSIRRSMMTFGMLGASDKEVEGHLRRFFRDTDSSADALKQRAKDRGMVVGTTQEAVDHLTKLGELGLQEIDLQHLNFDSDEQLEYFAQELAPRLKRL